MLIIFPRVSNLNNWLKMNNPVKNPLFAGRCKISIVVVLILIYANLSCNIGQVAGLTTKKPEQNSSEISSETQAAPSDLSSTLSPAFRPSPTSRSGGQSSNQPTTHTAEAIRPSATPVENIEVLLSTCPSETELERFKTDFHILFDDTISFPPYECHNGAGSNGQVNPRLALFQALRVIHALQFNQPLPWTDLSLYQWLRGAINGIVITDTEYSHCCTADTEIVLKADLFTQPDYRFWINPQSGCGLIGLIGLIVHEARHAEVGGHTCGLDDETLEELGAWGTQYYLFLYMAENSPPTFFNVDQQQIALNYAQTALGRICNPP
jgi:hypothetical protein